MLSIKLSNPKTIVVQPAKTKTIETLTVERIVDLPGQKKVRAFVNGIDGPIILWEGAAYDSVGQWSDTDVINRLNELYNSGTASNS